MKRGGGWSSHSLKRSRTAPAYVLKAKPKDGGTSDNPETA